MTQAAYRKVSPIQASEYRARREKILGWLAEFDAHGFVWWGNAYIFYLTGFAFVPTERPIALIVTEAGETVLFVPRLELEHAQTYAHVDRVVSYPEFPGETHPMEYLRDELKAVGLGLTEGTLLGLFCYRWAGA
jgi:Xaa-Pro aminopeptidase